MFLHRLYSLSHDVSPGRHHNPHYLHLFIAFQSVNLADCADVYVQPEVLRYSTTALCPRAVDRIPQSELQ